MAAILGYEIIVLLPYRQTNAFLQHTEQLDDRIRHAKLVGV